ncbi:MAG: amidohydrolase [Bacillota bacterium]
MTKEEAKLKVCQAIDARAGEITEIADTIFQHPELGYKEFKTAELVAKKLQEMGLSYQDKIGITGIKANLTGRSSEVRIGVMGELDSVLCPNHPHADPMTGAAHSCGHHGQIAAMLGVAMGLVDAGMMSELGGDVSLMAVPAEEYVEIEYRNELRRQGKIKFLGGKQEFIALGALDDIDLCMMMHLGGGDGAEVGNSSNGFVGKFIEYKGKEAHAGGAPHDGVNALNAAMLGLMGIHAQRETFKDSDHIRIHPIINKGGDLVNIIPADVRMETYVRGKSLDAIMDASRKTNRALKAGALAVGAEVEITEIPGYLPQVPDRSMDELFKANMESLIGDDKVQWGGHGTGSTDMGDVTQIMPAIQPFVGGCGGHFHSYDFHMVDTHLAYVQSAKAMAMTVIDLLWDDAKLAKEIKANFKPTFTKQSYLEMWEKLFTEE